MAAGRIIGCPGSMGDAGTVPAALLMVGVAKALAVSTMVNAATAAPATWDFLISRPFMLGLLLAEGISSGPRMPWSAGNLTGGSPILLKGLFRDLDPVAGAMYSEDTTRQGKESGENYVRIQC